MAAAKAGQSGLGEFERIARYFAPLAAPGALGLLDDAALIDGPPGEQYVLTTDTIVEGVHFLPGDPPDLVARKLLRVNLSDLAAKGAVPVGYLLTTILPRDRGEAWLASFTEGLAADQREFGIALLGGDSVASPGPAALSVAAIGRVGAGKAVLRGGARPGDDIYCSGTLGDAALGLKVLRDELVQLDAPARNFLAGRYRLPQPRLKLGQGLAGLAHATIDISDGLVADLGHICDVSAVGATIEAALVPLSPALRLALKAEPSLLVAALTGGDDYELLFTAPPQAAPGLAALAADCQVALTRIGVIEPGRGVSVVDSAGAALDIAQGGYRHF
jgi:thiamine-monophosphate kinase